LPFLTKGNGVQTARTFGRKGGADGGISPRRAASFGSARPADVEPAPAPALSRRAAFLASERARAADAAPAETVPEISAAQVQAVLNAQAAPPPPTDRSLKLSWPIWFFLGLAGGHRFYLRRPFTGALQAALFLGFAGATVMQYYWAFAGLLFSWIWYVADGIRLRTLHLHSGR
jgi:hypothetical protein